jgi:serpin B
MPTIDRSPLTRRRMLQACAVALAVANTPVWTAATHGQATPAADLVAGNTAFALALYGDLRMANDGNLLVSPYSISLALAMTWAGAAGDTATQMADVLAFDLDQADLSAAFHDLTDDLEDRGNAEEDPDEGQPARGLAIANALWGEQSYPFSESFMDHLEEDYGAGLHLVDFVDAPGDVRDEINDWVADQTEDRIENIVPEGVITEATRLVLANAVWFSGAWEHAFDPEDTEDGDFTLLDGDTVRVPFMFQHEHLGYAQGEGYQALELAYGGSGFAFTVLLPDEGEFETFEASLDPDSLDAILAGLASTDVQLSLPSFSFTFAASLAGSLQALGMTDAFDPDLADFSGMVDGPPADPLVIGDVLHKAFIALDEMGTEAAAATVVIMDVASAQEPEEPVEVRVDRPFLFAIRDTETGTLLFLGRVLDPRS